MDCFEETGEQAVVEYLNEDQKQEIRENNKILSGEFIREENEESIKNLKNDVQEIKDIVRPRSKFDIINGALKTLTGLDTISTVAKYGLMPMAKRSRNRKLAKARMANFFRRR